MAAPLGPGPRCWAGKTLKSYRQRAKGKEGSGRFSFTPDTAQHLPPNMLAKDPDLCRNWHEAEISSPMPYVCLVLPHIQIPIWARENRI